MTSEGCRIYEDAECDNHTMGSTELWPDRLDYEELQNLLDEDEDCKENVAELERMEEDVPWEERDSEYFARFLNEFPTQRQEIEKCIRCLWEMADDIDQTHKKCTIASIAANSTSASSGLLTILGLTLAPITAGGSLILTATGIGLGAVATATGLSATLYESVNNSQERKKAQELVSECEKSLRKAMHPDFYFGSPPNSGAVGENMKQLVSNVAGQVPDLYKAVKGIRMNVKALKQVRANPGLKDLAKRVTAAGSRSRATIRGAKHARRVFAGTTLAMSKGARLLSAASTGVFLLFDAYGIVQDAKHLTEGAKAETAAEIRKKASKLEEELRHIDRLYEEMKGLVCESE
uniref:apolipoprotein L2-like isoform X2 n=1 Tax=Podarcis muralis TaxID=64176 RepID=UPI00109FA307|nr:apolipoprotein L2-like isoform X2 [Podarcis muralis]